MYPSISQMSYQMSSARSDITGRSNSPETCGLYTPQKIDMPFENFPYQGEDFSGAQTNFHRDSMSSIVLTTGPSYSLYSTAGDDYVSVNGPSDLSSQAQISRGSLMYNPGNIMESAAPWSNGTDYLDSRTSSPVLLEDPWVMAPPPIMISTMENSLNYSPSIEGMSPGYVDEFPELVDLAPYATTGNRITRKPIGPRPSKVASDLAAASRRQRLPGSTENSEEPYKLVGRSSLELDNNARDHELYHNVTPHADGLYHCPWEKDASSNCQHKPEKLKCNYEYDIFLQFPFLFVTDHHLPHSKFVDSHLKPYKCKVSACKDLQFSSTACLLRHEREAHAMHGHGDKPFLCTYDGCERGVAGNGFPRHWNLRDHMKRVHNDLGQSKSASGSPPPSGPTKSKKRKAGENPESPHAEKAPKRTATPPPAEQPKEPKEPSLVDRYQEKQKMLMDIVKQLSDPTQCDNMDMLRSANAILKVMAQTTQRIQGTPAMGQTVDTYP